VRHLPALIFSQMRTIRLVLVLCGLGTLTLAGYHVAARANTYVASNVLPTGSSADLADRFPDLSGRTYQLANLRDLTATLDQVATRYVDPARVDYNAMFKAGLAAVEHQCPEVLLRVDEDRLHVSVDRYSTMLQLRPLETPDDVVAESRRVAQILQTKLPEGQYSLPDIEYALTNGMLSTLDPHTILLPPKAAKKMQEDNDGSFGGLGISIRMNNGELQIEYPMVGTPAWKAGLKPNDKIVKIDGEGTFNMEIEDAVSKMRGPAGTSVTITIEREGMGMPRDVKVVRAQIKPAPVWGELLGGNVGYVEIPTFNALTASELSAQLSDLDRQAGRGGLKGLVLDLRDNPGGYLQQAIQVSDKFLTQGVIVSTVGPNGTDRDETMAHKSGTEADYPIIVLMSASSASAAEIVAGALKNSERAVILGERSFGKGSVQEIMPFADTAELKLTVKRYLTPGDHSIQGLGIPPDIELSRSYVGQPRELKDASIKGAPVKSGPRVSMFSRDKLLRESDLSGHFTNDDNRETPPVYALRYLAPLPDETEVKSDRRDLNSDFEVKLARDVLISTRGGRRADVLRAAEPIVATYARGQEAAISAAFSDLRIDWSACAVPGSVDVDLKLELSTMGAERWGSTLTPGEFMDVRGTLRNNGTAPLCQMVGRAASPDGNDILDGTDFYFGKVAPGAERTYITRVRVPGGYPSERAVVALTLTDLGKSTLYKTSTTVETVGVALPRYQWDWSFDDSVGGDGDGLPEVGETVALKVKVTNVGEGAGGEVTFSLRKDSELGKAVELKEARFAVEGLAPGASKDGTLQIRIAAEVAEGLVPLEVTVRENERYDYGTVMRAGFYEYYVATDKITLELGKAPAPLHRQPPRIEITRAPASSTSDGSVTISGVATDDRGVRDVIIYNGRQKLTFAGGGDESHPAPTLPFTATAELTDGNNMLVIAARDADGLITTTSIDVLRTSAVAQAPAK
jgi:carboxyl-terminal processing protease